MGENNRSFEIDVKSFELGMINCFIEMVACGVKKLALSPPILPENYEDIKKLSDKMVDGFSIKSYLEKELLVTDIQSEEFTRGKWNILYYDRDEVLEEYLELKGRKEELERKGKYIGAARKEISREFGRLLSYPENKIEEKISKTEPPTPFTLV